MAIELQNRQHPIAHADRNRAAGDHPAPLGGFRVRIVRLGCQIGNPNRASILPSPSGHSNAGRQSQPHAVFDQGLGFAPRSIPARAELQPVFFGIHFPFQGHVPALGDAKRLKNAHRGDFRGDVFAHNLANHPLQRHPPFALDKQA